MRMVATVLRRARWPGEVLSAAAGRAVRTARRTGGARRRRRRRARRHADQVDDRVVTPELGEVLEREVDRPGHPARAAQGTELVELSFAAVHSPMLQRRADPALLARCAVDVLPEIR